MYISPVEKTRCDNSYIASNPNNTMVNQSNKTANDRRKNKEIIHFD